MSNVLAKCVELFYRLVLKVMLLVLGWKITSRSRGGKHEKLEALLKNKQSVLQFQTQDKRSINQLVIADSVVSVNAGEGRAAALTVNFINAQFAVKTLAAGDMNTYLKAIQEKKIEVTGDYSLLMWFMSLVKSALR